MIGISEEFFFSFNYFLLMHLMVISAVVTVEATAVYKVSAHSCIQFMSTETKICHIKTTREITIK